MEKEIRFLTHEVRLDGDEKPKIRGYAAVLGQRTDLGMFDEIIEPSFFEGRLGDDVRGLWNHDNNFVLGRTASGTLRLFLDETGLGYEIDPPDAQWARDFMKSIQRGDVNQSSFQFTVAEEEWVERTGEKPLRRLLRCEQLYDVSPVTFPAYPQTSASVRSKLEELARHEPESESGNEPEGEQKTPRQGLDLLRRRLELANLD